MISPLHIPHGTLPADNAPTSPLTNFSLPSIESSSRSGVESFTRSYASVTATTTPGHSSLRFLSKLSPSSNPRKTYSLFRSAALGGRSNDINCNVLHRTGTTEHSMFYQVPKNQCP